MFDLSLEVTVKVITIWWLKKATVHKPVIYKIILPMEQSFRHKKMSVNTSSIIKTGTDHTHQTN